MDHAVLRAARCSFGFLLENSIETCRMQSTEQSCAAAEAETASVGTGCHGTEVCESEDTEVTQTDSAVNSAAPRHSPQRGAVHTHRVAPARTVQIDARLKNVRDVYAHRKKRPN